MTKDVIFSSGILLPDFYGDGERMSRYSVIACDQFTSEPEYWDEVRSYTSGYDTTLDLMLPEICLDKSDELLVSIHKKMDEFKNDIYEDAPAEAVYVERTLPSNGKIRRGIVCRIDLEDYEYVKGSKSLVRSSEQTVIERIPARVKIRRGAAVELPHVMLFYDDASNGLNGYMIKIKEERKKLYDFDLMLGSGNIKGYALDEDDAKYINSYLLKNCLMKDKDGDGLVLTVGDGNHSLAAAKSYYCEMKQKFGDQALKMPCRYALVEIVNIHDDAIEFEPIYRLVKKVSSADLIKSMSKYFDIISAPTDNCFRYDIVSDEITKTVYVNNPETALPVAEIQRFLDDNAYGIDYIHGIGSIKSLAKDNNTGIIFDGMKKSDLFKAVMLDGALPRKTFSMGDAKDKRFYLEARAL